jgi:hypothetical protein
MFVMALILSAFALLAALSGYPWVCALLLLFWLPAYASRR